jgi:hypothetical protein
MEIDAPVNARIPFHRKWEIHKPLLQRLYLDKTLKLSDIKKFMRDEHDFDAEKVLPIALPCTEID